MAKRIAMVLAIGMGAVAFAQTRPNFSGVWVPGPPKTTSAAETRGTAALPPSDLTIQHTPESLAISRTAFDIVTTQTFKLDGSESTTRTGAVTKVTRGRWDGPRLVIEGKASQVTSAGYAAWTIKDTYSLNARGHLILESEHKTPDGKVTLGTLEFIRKQK